jgi:hypothetical protein
MSKTLNLRIRSGTKTSDTIHFGKGRCVYFGKYAIPPRWMGEFRPMPSGEKKLTGGRKKGGKLKNNEDRGNKQVTLKLNGYNKSERGKNEAKKA